MKTRMIAEPEWLQNVLVYNLVLILSYGFQLKLNINILTSVQGWNCHGMQISGQIFRLFIIFTCQF
jgi:hypothetical protein